MEADRVSTRNPKSPSLEWSAIQTLLEKATSDALLLLDCCSAASAAPQAGHGMTEIIAACGWESIAPEPGRFSFTDTLIEVLEEWINRPFTAAMLHSEILSRLKHERPEMIGSQRRECRRTPIYIVSSSDLGACSIELSRLRSPSGQNHTASSASPTSFGLAPPSGNGAGDGITSPSKLTVPHVLISIALEEDQTLDSNACSQWLSRFPALATHATVQGVYQSHSTLVLLAVPVAIWDLLPQNPACSFIAYVRSTNLTHSPNNALGSQLPGRPGNEMESKVQGHSDRNILALGPSSEADEGDYSTNEAFKPASWDHKMSQIPYDTSSPDKIFSRFFENLNSGLASFTSFCSIKNHSSLAWRIFANFSRRKWISQMDAGSVFHYEVRY